MKVKYKVTNDFASIPLGIIINAVLVCQDTGSGIGLLFHPKIKRDYASCPTFELCKYDYVDRCWISMREDTYINLDDTYKKDLKKFLTYLEKE